MKVQFTYNNGKTKTMAETFAKTLEKMKLGTYSVAVMQHQQHRSMQSELIPSPAPETRVVTKKTERSGNSKRNANKSDDALNASASQDEKILDPVNAPGLSELFSASCDSSIESSFLSSSTDSSGSSSSAD